MVILIYTWRFNHNMTQFSFKFQIFKCIFPSFALQNDRLHSSMADPLSQKRPSHYQKYDPITKKIRQAAVESLTTTYIEHINSNGRKCKRNFVKGLIDQAQMTAAGLNITRHDITKHGP